MAALLILIIVTYGVLHAPTHASRHRPAPQRTAHAQPARRHARKTSPHAQARHHAKPKPKPKPAQQARHTPKPRPTPTRHTRTASGAASLTWTSFHGIELPGSAAAGPRDKANGLAAGFADTRDGALLAAINIAVRTAPQWGPGIFRPTIARQVTGPGTAALLRADTWTFTSLRAGPGRYPDQPNVVEQAYRFLRYSPRAATIEVVTSAPSASGSPALAMTTLRVLWLHRDWRLVAPPAGDWAKAATAISSLAGYTIFPAER